MSFPRPSSLLIESDYLNVEGRLQRRIRNCHPASGKLEGEHWLFEPSTTAARTTYAIQLGGKILDAVELAAIGFWVPLGIAEGIPRLTEGDHIRADLRLIPGAIPIAFYAKTLSMLPLRERVTESCDQCPNNNGLPLEYDPGPFQTKGLRVEYSIHDDWLNKRFNEMQAAAAMWRQKTNALISVNAYVTDPFAHFVVQLDNSIPGLARTIYEINGRRPGRQSAYPLLIRTDWEWNAPGSQPSGAQYDFVTTFAHELGHALGLDHIDTSDSNVMNTYIANGIRKTPQPDDIRCMNELIG